MAVTQSTIDQYRADAQTASTSALDFASKGATVESELRDALNSKLSANKPLIEGRNKAQADYLAAPAVSRNTYGNPESEDFIFNPYERGKLIAQDQSLAYQPFANLTDFLGLSMGTISDIIGQAGKNYQAEANTKNQAAQVANNQYTSALNEYLALQGLELDKMKANESSSSSPIEALLMQALLGGGEEETPTTSSSSYNGPMFSPGNGSKTKVGSDGVVWEYVGDQWIPRGRV